MCGNHDTFLKFFIESRNIKIESLKELHLFEVETSVIFTVTFDQFNTSLLNKSIN